MAGTSVSAMSKDISGLSGSTGERCTRPKPQDAMAPLVMMVWDSPGTRRRSACRNLAARAWRCCLAAAYIQILRFVRTAWHVWIPVAGARALHRTHANNRCQDGHKQRPAANAHRIGQHRTLQSAWQGDVYGLLQLVWCGNCLAE